VERRSLRDYYIILRERLWIALPLALLVSLSYGLFTWPRKRRCIPARPRCSSSAPDRIVTNDVVVDSSVRSDIDLNTYLRS